MWNLFPGSRFGVQRLDCHSGRFNAPLLETPGADPAPDDAGGDSPSPEGETVSDDEPVVEPASSAGADEDDEDLIAGRDDDDTDSRTPEERIKALAKKNRQLVRRLTKHLPTLTRLKGLDLDDLLTRARRGDQFAEMVGNNPKLRALLHGDEPEAPAGRTAKAGTPATDPDDDEFDESALPFDPELNDANRYFAKMARDNHELKKTLRQLQGKETQRENDVKAQAAASERTTWRTSIEAAAEHLPEGAMRTYFKDAMAGAYATRATHGKSVTDLIAHYLKAAGVDPKTAGKANKAAAAVAPAPAGNTKVAAAAQRERIASTNQPRTVAPPAGAPTTARRQGETLKDVHKRIRNLTT